MVSYYQYCHYILLLFAIIIILVTIIYYYYFCDGVCRFLDKVIVKSESLKKEWYFLCGRWLSKDHEDNQIARELVAQDEDGVAAAPLVRYKVAVTTG